MSTQETTLSENLQKVASARQIPQYSVAQVLVVWAGAALPMGFLAWVAAPRLAEVLEGPTPLVQALFITMTVGLVWQFLMVVALVRWEQGDPDLATIAGTIDDQTVDTTVDRTDGRGVSDWDDLLADLASRRRGRRKGIGMDPADRPMAGIRTDAGMPIGDPASGHQGLAWSARMVLQLSSDRPAVGLPHSAKGVRTHRNDATNAR